jgi:hypothetical protein
LELPNFDKKPDGMPYDQWLREKGVSVRVTEPIDKYTKAPMSIHNYLKNKPNEIYERALARQGKPLAPEDIGEA